VAISAGTTTYAVARELPAVPHLTVVTNSVPVGKCCTLRDGTT
jgi:DeoR/GlpR family transcriptional regulator of sugar metabolism